MPAILDTGYLFLRLIPTLRVSTVCDVGSLDGADALRFRQAVPRGSIYAFEPHPENFRRMVANAGLAARGITTVPLAVSDTNGEADFFLVAVDDPELHGTRGMSSLHRRAAPYEPADTVRIATTRLDTFLTHRGHERERIALWIDVEGKAYEVLAGITAVVPQVQLLHVEVETKPCIGSQQKLYADVSALLQSLGFAELATDQPRWHLQFNALFVRRNVGEVQRLRVHALLLLGVTRQFARKHLTRFCPNCLSRYRRLRARLTPGAL